MVEMECSDNIHQNKVANSPNILYNIKMDELEETRRLLKRNLAISEESFKILKKLRRVQKISSFITFTKWTIIILLAFGTYYYIQPFMETFWQTIGQIRQDVSAIGEASNEIKELPPTMLENIKSFFENNKPK